MFRFPRLTPFVKKMLIGLFGAFIASVVLENWLDVPVGRLIALQAGNLGWPTLWQVFTYPAYYPPQAVVSLLLSLVFLWWMLAPFEERYGARRTMQLCLAAVVSGGSAVLVVSLFGPGRGEVLFGSNVIILAAIAAFVWPMRHQQTQISVFGVLPMRPIHLLYGIVGLSFLFFLANRHTAQFVADLGAIAGGIGFVEWMTKPRPRGGSGRRKPAPKKRKFEVIEGGIHEDDKPRWLN